MTTELSLEAICKRFGATRALDEVSLDVHGGEVVALIGENGAGKSTLMKVLAGVVMPDAGRLLLDGRERRFASPREAMDAGIALIHQELNLHEHLSVAENCFLGREPLRGGVWSPLMLCDFPLMRQRAAEVLERVGLTIDPRTLVGSLSIAQKQLVEIARALTMRAAVLVLDEPTSSLSDAEAAKLFEVIEQLRVAGTAVIYISHRLPEIVRIARRVEVLRDGRHVATLVGPDIAPEKMVRAMVGRDLVHRGQDRAVLGGTPRLRVSRMRVEKRSSPPISLDVHAGEVVAIAGRLGSGRTELAETIFGIRGPAGGTVEVDGQLVGRGVRAAIGAGIGLVPEDRKLTGLLIHSDVRDNATLVAMSRAPSSPRLDRRWQTRLTSELIQRWRIKTASPTAPIGSLSGGNQQKVALAKWIPCGPKVLILDEPTRGVDIGAKAEIYELIDQLVDEGLAVLVISSELEEIEALADRVIEMEDLKRGGSI